MERFSPSHVGKGISTLVEFLEKKGYTLRGGGVSGLSFTKVDPKDETKEVQFVINNVVVRRRTRPRAYKEGGKVRWPWRTTHVGYLALVGVRAGKLVGIRRVGYGKREE